jgi:hypothetical protein
MNIESFSYETIEKLREMGKYVEYGYSTKVEGSENKEEIENEIDKFRKYEDIRETTTNSIWTIFNDYEGIQKKLIDPIQIDKEDIKNRYDENQMDEIIHLRNRQIYMTYYHVRNIYEKYILQEFILFQTIGIKEIDRLLGMSRNDLENMYGRIKSNGTNEYKISPMLVSDEYELIVLLENALVVGLKYNLYYRG